MKKFLALLLVGIMLMSTILTGCGNTAAEPTEGKTPDAPVVDSGDNAPAATGEKKKLTIAIRSDPLITDYEDNSKTRHMEEQLGVDLDFILLSADEFNTKVALWASSGEDLPDILLGDKLSDANAIMKYGSDEYFLNVGDYLKNASKMPNFNALPEEDRASMLSAMTLPDGNIYAFPYQADNPWNSTPYRYYINRVWLDKLDLEVPTTLDELKEVLIAFRDKDPNGNGIKDEIPLYGMASGTYGQNVLYALMNSFTFFNANSMNCGVELGEDGKIYAPYTTEEWKKGLEFMHELYAEDLLDPSVFTNDTTQFKAVLNAETNVVGVLSSGSYGNWTDTINNPNFLEMEMMAPMTGPDGVCYTSYFKYEATPKGFIFADSENIDLAIRFMDQLYHPKTALTAYGVEGVHWTTDPAELANWTCCYIEEGIFEKPALALIEDIWSQSHNHHWRDVGPRYQSLADICCTCRQTKANYNPADPSNLYAFNLEHYLPKHPDVILPNALKFTEAESKQILDASVNLDNYVDQAMAEFITGLRDFDTGWTQYLAELENIGLSEYIKVAQVAYDRTLN